MATRHRMCTQNFTLIQVVWDAALGRALRFDSISIPDRPSDPLVPMPLAEPPPVAPPILRNEFARLQLEVAREADRLARHAVSNRPSDLDLWQQAEHGVFARHFRTADAPESGEILHS